MFNSSLNKNLLSCFSSFLFFFIFFNVSIVAEKNSAQKIIYNDKKPTKSLIQTAKQNDAQATEQKAVVTQFLLGVAYLEGQGVKKDGQKAFDCFQKAADQGFPTAQFFLGKMYAEGREIGRNERKAFKWFQKAANKGHIEAQFSLGKMYAEGRGVEKNERKAFEWFQRAADEGHGASQFFLGKMYAEGRGVEKNEKIAFELFKQAAEQRYPIEKAIKTLEATEHPETFTKLSQLLRSQKEIEIPFDANVKKLASFRDALPLLDDIPSDALVIFDMDDTLIVYRDESLPPALTESIISDLIKNLQNKGIATIALTKTTIKDALTKTTLGDLSQEELRSKELLNVGIDFSRSFREFAIFNNLPLYEGHYPLLSKGIIYTNNIPKGKVLLAFLDKLEAQLKPSLIIFFDDRLDNVLDVKKAVEERNIKYVGFYYNRILNLISNGMSYQDIQVKQLLQNKSIHPGANASPLLISATP
jgi:CobQ-like glutamine amidotransferase family enzyme